MEPICLNAFNNARECLFRSDMKLRYCKNELEYFEECYHDPLGYAKFEELATRNQATPKHYFSHITKNSLN